MALVRAAPLPLAQHHSQSATSTPRSHEVNHTGHTAVASHRETTEPVVIPWDPRLGYATQHREHSSTRYWVSARHHTSAGEQAAMAQWARRVSCALSLIGSSRGEKLWATWVHDSHTASTASCQSSDELTPRSLTPAQAVQQRVSYTSSSKSERTTERPRGLEGESV